MTKSIKRIFRRLLVFLGIAGRKRVYIMTYQWADNFGAQMQNYALAEKIKELGYYPRTIKWGYNYYNSLGVRRDTLRFFSDGKIFKTKLCYTEKELKKAIYEGSRFIFGGDQIFRCWKGQVAGIEMPILRYYGDFVSGKKVIASYAASFGIDRFEGDKYLTEECRKLLKRFDRLSVREQSGVDILKHTFGVNGIEVLDPVFLFSEQKYEELILSANNLVEHEPGYIGYMRLGDKSTLYPRTNKILENRYIINTMYDEHGAYNTVEQWLYNFKNALFVITTSFHGTAFAIIFHKPFIAIHPHGHDKRISNLLENLELQNCQRKTIDDISADDLSIFIDWHKTDRIIQSRQVESLNYLNEILNLKPTYKVPYHNRMLRNIRTRYERAYYYRKKAQNELDHKFGKRQRIIKLIIKFLVDGKKYNKLERDYMLFFQDSKSRFIRVLGRFYN